MTDWLSGLGLLCCGQWEGEGNGAGWVVGTRGADGKSYGEPRGNLGARKATRENGTR